MRALALAPSPQPWLKSLIREIGGRARHPLNRIVAQFSRLPNDPVLSPSIFSWSARLTSRWRRIRFEVARAMPVQLPSVADLAPDHLGINPDRLWKCVFLLGYGHRMPEMCARFPETWAAIRDIPGLFSAMISVHEPGAHLERHRGVTKGMLTVHLPLVVPRDADRCRIEIDGEVHVWREGRLLVFDDTYEHETWNDTDEARVILLLHILRPLRAPGSWLQALLFMMLRRSSFVRDAARNVRAWCATTGADALRS